MVRYLAEEDLLWIHHHLVETFYVDFAEENTTGGVLKQDMFELAVYRPRQSAGGEDAFPTLELKAAALTEAIIRHHPFVDANKRTGILAGVVMLDINGRTTVADSHELYELAIAVEDGHVSLVDLSIWFDDWDNVLPLKEQEWFDLGLGDPDPFLGST